MVETRLLQPIFEIFSAPSAIRMGPISGKHRPVRVGSPATHSGATIPGGEKPGPGTIPATPAHRLPTADFARCRA
jgi:hypothetical protein